MVKSISEAPLIYRTLSCFCVQIRKLTWLRNIEQDIIVITDQLHGQIDQPVSAGRRIDAFGFIDQHMCFGVCKLGSLRC